MRTFFALVVVAACSSQPAAPQSPTAPAPAPTAAPAPTSNPATAGASKPQPLADDTPETTTAGNTFVAPKGWTVERKGDAVWVSPPEPGSHIALIDEAAATPDEAVERAWKTYKPDRAWPLLAASDGASGDGWAKRRSYAYQTSPNERRSVAALALSAGSGWTVAIYDMDQGVEEKRGGQIAVILGRLQPKGYTRESFAGKTAAKLDRARIEQLATFVENAAKQLGVPGVGLGLVQDGQVVLATGYGLRELGGKQKVDGDTLFMIASNTKALTTLLLAKLVEDKKLSWDTLVTSLLPTFALGDPDVTRQVQVKHLICACTGMPRQDLEWIFEFKGATAATTMATLAKMKPTTKFGEMFQYSNIMAAAAGFVAGHVAYPSLELGAAYDKAIQARVLDPLGMKATTFDYARALRGNHAMPESPDVDGKPARGLMELDYAAIPVRPAGAAWSSVRDMLRYIQMELAEGKLPDGKVYIAKEPLLERRVPQVPIGKDETYGMGLMVDHTWGIPVVHHGGDLLGFHSDMIWLPEHNVGAVVLTNGDPGWLIRDALRRKLLEVLFDGKPEADASLAAAGKDFFDSIAVQRKLLVVPADPAAAGKLAARYHNDGLGDLAVTHAGGKTYFDFGEFKTEVATKQSPDGSLSFVTLAPGLGAFEVVVGTTNGKRTLTARDAQHEYVFEER